jgi:hypothetical protein
MVVIPHPDSSVVEYLELRGRLSTIGRDQDSLATIHSVAIGVQDKYLDDHGGLPGWRPREAEASRQAKGFKRCLLG